MNPDVDNARTVAMLAMLAMFAMHAGIVGAFAMHDRRRHRRLLA